MHEHLLAVTWKKPFKDRIMNWMECTFVTFLLILDGISVLDATQVYNVTMTNDIKELINILHILKVIILASPFLILGLFMLIDRCYSTTKRKDEEKNR